jgi:Flp pilus assembly protein TadD
VACRRGPIFRPDYFRNSPREPSSGRIDYAVGVELVRNDSLIERALVMRINPKNKKTKISSVETGGDGLLGWIVPIIVTILTMVVFIGVLQNGFVDWDDDRVLLENDNFRGLNWLNIQWMFTTFYKSLYRPLTWVSFGFDYLLWGMNPVGYHVSSLLLHVTNAFLVYLLAFRIYSLPAIGFESLGKPTRRIVAGIVALLFAIHPLRVEPVAWVSARNDLISALFVLASVICYLEYAQAAERLPAARRWGGFAVVMYSLAMLSKASNFALPLVFLVLDVYPLGRWRQMSIDGFGPAVRKLVWEKIPLFLVSVVGAAVAFAAKQSEAMIGFEQYGLGERVAQSIYGVIFYTWKTVVPLGLSPLYSLSAQSKSSHLFIVISTTGVVGLTVGLLYLRKRWPAPLTAWVCYGLMIAPVLGLVQSGPQAVADRYSYLPCLVWVVLGGAFLIHTWQNRQNNSVISSLSVVLGGAVVLLMVAYGLMSWNQTHVWRDSETLWQRVVVIEPASSMGHNSLGAVLLKQGNLPAAERHLRESLRLAPTHARTHNNLANALSMQGKFKEAIEHYDQALAIDPDYAKAHYNLANALIRQDDLNRAIEHYRRAIELDGDYVKAHYRLGIALASRQEFDEAIKQFRQTVRIQPEFGEAHVSLGRALAALGEREQAVKHYQEGLRILKSKSSSMSGRELDVQ